MSKYSDKFNNHPFLGVWESLLTLADDKTINKLLNEDSAKDFARLKKVLSHLNSIVTNIDPDLFPFQLLSSMQSQTQACLNEINAFKGNGNPGHLQNANNHIDQLLAIFQQLPASLYSLSTENVNSMVSSYAKTMGDFIEEYQNKTDENLSELEEKLLSLEEMIVDKEKRLQKLDTELTTISQTIQQQTTEFNTQYQASEKERSEKFNKAFEKYTNSVDHEFKTLATKSAKIIEVLTKLKDDASKVYNVTINTLQGGAYSSYADEEKGTANLLRYLAGFLMLSAVGFLVVPEFLLILEPGEYIFDWKKTLGRVPISFVLFVPAFYLARESGKHRLNEIANRRRQHILTTLDPYIELMDEDKAQDLKSHVAKTVFSDISTVNDSTEETGNLISQLANLAKQLKK